MKAFAELAPFAVHALGASPFAGFWPFNPSVIRTPDGRWLCSVRCANYHLPGSGLQAQRQPGPIRNRNLMLTLDPKDWRVTSTVEMVDRSNGSGRWAKALGFEDLRLAWTDRDGLCAIGCSMRIDNATIEMVALELDADYQIRCATPLRCEGHQKNWSPYADADELRLLHSPLGGGIHGRTGRIIATHPPVMIDGAVPALSPTIRAAQAGGTAYLLNGAMDIKIGGRDVASPASRPRLALRGGTQLVPVAPGQWLGLAHGCRVGNGRKNYWHRAMLYDHDGHVLAMSEPFKLAPAVGIEFACGLAIDRDTDRAVISFGIEDDSANLGISTLSAILAMLKPIDADRTKAACG